MDELRTTVVDFCKSQTEHFGTQFGSDPKCVFSPKATEIGQIIGEVGGCSRDKLKKLVELIIGEPVPMKETPGALDYPAGTIFKLTKKLANRPSYEKGALFCVDSSAYRAEVFNSEGQHVGDNLPKSRKSVVPATPQEIVAFVNALPLSKLATILAIAEVHRKQQVVLCDEDVEEEVLYNEEGEGDDT